MLSGFCSGVFLIGLWHVRVAWAGPGAGRRSALITGMIVSPNNTGVLSGNRMDFGALREAAFWISLGVILSLLATGSWTWGLRTDGAVEQPLA